MVYSQSSSIAGLYLERRHIALVSVSVCASVALLSLVNLIIDYFSSDRQFSTFLRGVPTDIAHTSAHIH